MILIIQRWQDWIVDDKLDQEVKFSQDQELGNRKRINE